MRSQLESKPVLFLSLVWAFSLLVWGGAASVARSYDAAQQAMLTSSAISTVPEAPADGGCPYPPGTPGVTGDEQSAPGLVVPGYRPAPRGPVRPAVFYELYFPAGSADELISI